MSHNIIILLLQGMTEDQKVTAEDLIGPPRVDFIQVWLTSIWSIIAWFVWSIIILIAIYFFLQKAQWFDSIYAYIYIATATVATLVTAWINYVMNKIINPDKYKRWSTIFVQNFFLTIFIFSVLIFAYVIVAAKNKDFLIYIFTLHITIAMLWYSLISEILSSYRYSLIWIYWTYIWCLLSILLTSSVLITLWGSSKSLYILIWLLIVINFSINTVKSLFEFFYYSYYSSTWMDQLWDIYYQIEKEEKELVEKAKKELETF